MYLKFKHIYFYIIDNSSNDSLREYSQISEKIKYIHSQNLGFGHGHNIALEMALAQGAKYHVIINPDIYWKDNVIEELTSFMDKNNDCGQVMPKILYPNGETQLLCKLIPTPINLIGRRFIPIKAIKQKSTQNMSFTTQDITRLWRFLYYPGVSCLLEWI